MSRSHSDVVEIETITFGEFVRARRKARGITQLVLARRTGISQPFLSDLERDCRYPSDKVLDNLAKTLAIAPESLRQHNTMAVIRDFQDLMAANPLLGAAFAKMVRDLERGAISVEIAANRLFPPG